MQFRRMLCPIPTIATDNCSVAAVSGLNVRFGLFLDYLSAKHDLG